MKKMLMVITVVFSFVVVFVLNLSLSTNNQGQVMHLINSAEGGVFGGNNKVPCFSSITNGSGMTVVFCSDCLDRECENRDTQGKCVPQGQAGK